MGGLFYLEPICPCYVTISVPMYWTKLHVMRVYIHRMYDDCFSCIFRLLHNFRRQKAKVKLSSLDSSGHARVILGKNENFRLLSKVFNWRKRRENLLMSNQILVKRKDSSSLSINALAGIALPSLAMHCNVLCKLSS